MGRPLKDDRATIRTERVSLVLASGALEGVKTLAQIQKVSVNEFISSLVEAVVKKNLTVIDKFNRAQKEAAAAVNLDV